MTSVQGERTQVIDLALINTTLSGLSSSFDRLVNLLNPNWKAAPKMSSPIPKPQLEESQKKSSDGLIYLVGIQRIYPMSNGNKKITLTLNKASSTAQIDGEPYAMDTEHNQYTFIGRTEREKVPVTLNRTDLNFYKFPHSYQMRIVDVSEFNKVFKHVMQRKKLERIEDDRTRKEKLDARKL